MSVVKFIVYSLIVTFISCKGLDLLRSVNQPDIITKINNMNTTWTAGHNSRFDNMTLKDVVRLLGVIETPKEMIVPRRESPILQDLPENFDLRVKWSQCESLFEIRDQSNCGSCWAFGAAEAMSDRICIKSGGILQTRVSAENIVACCKTCGNGCKGGVPIAAWEYWRKNGIPSGGLYGDKQTCQPYSFPPCDHHINGTYGPCSIKYDTPICSQTCQNGKTVKEDLTFATTAYFVGYNEQSIMSDIYQNGSVEAVFSVYEDLYNYKSGVYQYVTGMYLGGHAIKIIGWGVENGVKYWLAANSWNDQWGDKGFFKILRGKNHVNIESNVTAGIPRIPTKFLLDK
jgi:cathepsin B